MRKAPDPSARLKLLMAARDRLPPRKQLVVNLEEMATIIGLSARRVKDLIEADSGWPAIRRGSEGVAWQFDAKKVLDHLIRRANEAMVDRRKQAERITRIAGVDIDPDLVADAGLTISDLRTIDTLQTSAQRKKIEQQRYVLRDEHEEVIAQIFQTMQAETLATVSRLDPAGRWPAEVRSAVSDAMRSLLVRLHNQLGDRLKPDAGSPDRTRKRAKPAGRGQVLRKRPATGARKTVAAPPA